MPQQARYFVSKPHRQFEDAMEELKANLEALVASGKIIQSQSLVACELGSGQYVVAMMVIYV